MTLQVNTYYRSPWPSCLLDVGWDPRGFHMRTRSFGREDRAMQEESPTNDGNNVV